MLTLMKMMTNSDHVDDDGDGDGDHGEPLFSIFNCSTCVGGFQPTTSTTSAVEDEAPARVCELAVQNNLY